MSAAGNKPELGMRDRLSGAVDGAVQKVGDFGNKSTRNHVILGVALIALGGLALFLTVDLAFPGHVIGEPGKSILGEYLFKWISLGQMTSLPFEAAFPLIAAGVGLSAVGIGMLVDAAGNKSGKVQRATSTAFRAMSYALPFFLFAIGSTLFYEAVIGPEIRGELPHYTRSGAMLGVSVPFFVLTVGSIVLLRQRSQQSSVGVPDETPPPAALPPPTPNQPEFRKDEIEERLRQAKGEPSDPTFLEINAIAQRDQQLARQISADINDLEGQIQGHAADPIPRADLEALIERYTTAETKRILRALFGF